MSILIKSIPDGWAITKEGRNKSSRLSPGGLADLLLKVVGRKLKWNCLTLEPEFENESLDGTIQNYFHILLSQNTLWAKERSQKDIKKMLSKSSVIISVWEYQKLIGFGRATSDEVFRATLWDVVVDECYQSLGIGEKIIQSILKHSFISNVERVYLMTTFGEKFYSKIGFQVEKKQTLMKLRRK